MGFIILPTGEQVMSYMHQYTLGSVIWPQTSVTSELIFSLSRDNEGPLRDRTGFYLFTPGQSQSQDFAELLKIIFELRFKETLRQVTHIYHSRG